LEGEEGFRAINIEVFQRSFRKTFEEIMPHILERTKKIGAVYLGNIDHDIVMTDTDAAYSFVLGVFGATIFFASRAVEMAINKDGRMQERRTKSPWEWLTLSRKVLKEARANGLPVDLLLNAEEVRLECDPVFVLRRNKVVHGDTEGYKEATGFYRTTDFTKPYELPVAPSEDEACDQLIKSRKFLIEWIKSGSTHVPKGTEFARR
jgi:hypothetical protein